MNNRVKELLKNIGLFTLTNFGSKVLVFLMVPLYTYVLSTGEYGISSIIQSTETLLFPLVTIEISQAVLRYCYLKEENNTNDVFACGFKITVFGCAVGAIVSLFLVQLPLFREAKGVSFFIPLLLVGHSFHNLLTRFARGIDKVHVSAVSGVLSTFSMVVFNLLFLVVFRVGVFGYLLSFFLSDIVATLYLSYKCDVLFVIKRGVYKKDLAKEMIRYSLPLSPNSMSWWFLSSFNSYIILHVLGAVSVGLYSAALRIPSILTVVADLFAQAWLLSVFNSYGSKENADFIKSMHRRFFALLSVVTGAIILFSYPIAHLLLVGDFVMGWKIIPLLFVVVFLGALIGFYSSIFSAEKKNLTQLVSTISGAIVSILIVVFFLRKYDLVCVAVATLVGHYIIWLIRKERVKKYINLGMGTIEATIKACLLVLEAAFVMREEYFWAICVFLFIFTLNYKNIKEVAVFSIGTANEMFNKRIKKRW